MLASDHLENLPDYKYFINRAKIRFSGTGPWIHDSQAQESTKIWPRDSIDWVDESRKILYDELRDAINNQDYCEHVRDVIRQTFQQLQKCNINSLYNRFCPLDSGHFNRVPFAIHHALDCYTTYKQIMDFIYHIFSSVYYKKSGSFMKTMFGCNRNFDIFKTHISELISGSEKLQRMQIGYFVSFGPLNMDLSTVRWLDGVDIKLKYRIFIQIVYALVRFILDLLRRYFYITIGNHTSDKLFYYRYDLWQRIQKRNIEDLIDRGVFVVIPHDDQIEYHPVSVSKLRFHLKKDGLRPICIQAKYTPSIKRMNSQTVAVLKAIIENSTRQPRFTLTDLLTKLNVFKQKMIDQQMRIYMVRADIKDCFQSVDQELLRKTIMKKLQTLVNNDQVIKLFRLECVTKKQENPIDGDGRSRSYKTWSLNPDSVKNNKRLSQAVVIEGPIDLSLTDFDRCHLQQHIITPIIKETRQSKKELLLLRGLRQGSPISPMLCSIYIQAAFDQHLDEFITSESCHLFRYVDDILFISTDIDEAKRFMHKMLKGFVDFNLRMNIDKLSCNFTCPGLDDELCRLNDFAVFYKRRIALKDLNCSQHYVFNDIPLHYTFNVNPYMGQDRLTKSIRTIKVNLIYLDLKLNGLDGVVDNIFKIGLLVAHRLAASIKISYHMRSINNQQLKFITEIIWESSKKIYLHMRSGVRRKLIENDLTKSEVRIIVASAFLATWKRVHMRSRKLELEEIHRVQRRLLIRISIIQLAVEDRREYWRNKVNSLLDGFVKSHFINEAILPLSRHRLF